MKNFFTVSFLLVVFILLNGCAGFSTVGTAAMKTSNAIDSGKLKLWQKLSCRISIGQMVNADAYTKRALLTMFAYCKGRNI